ncbi:heme/copper-type cytochrome/quinol oxidase subunit 2 [Staphylococcus auricularis]|uniref:Uncharacterized protein n=1 Tax=Staphylococcus auricularis TaxID=29379 RepID=A0AAP8PMH4_9STAP|nr:hypothetical protein [Staphylococcus auricularis]PNZ65749.1 hypothetical protein CD158_10650 [Staphylococcus auricularis]BCU51248.1 hypothetical protein JCM2421_00200 [Staphylococcus auricularis]SQJ05862.1 Uncharacterised protein [Staphylococcus auricularis]
MLITILIILILTILIPTIYFGIQYIKLKKAHASDQKFEHLTANMMRADSIIIPIMLLLVVLLYIFH